MLACCVAVAATIPLAIWITHTQSAELGNAQARCAGKPGPVHTVMIQAGKVMPPHIEAKLCDRLRITNLDPQVRLLAFGKHESHVSYDGISEKLLDQGQSLQVTLGSRGTYLFHDHEDDNARGSFTVTDPAVK